MSYTTPDGIALPLTYYPEPLYGPPPPPCLECSEIHDPKPNKYADVHLSGLTLQENAYYCHLGQKPCHSCGYVYPRYDICNDCDYCPDCCEGHGEQCANCGWSAACEIHDCCEESLCSCCNACQECCEGNERSNRRSEVKPGWEVRGIPTPASGRMDAADRATKVCNDAGFHSIDVAQSMADFYLLDYCQMSNSPTSPLLQQIQREAKQAQATIVTTCDKAFREYVFLAVGGEARYHPNVPARTDRQSFWGHWLTIADKCDRVTLLQDVIELFRDDNGFESGFGGEPWAVAADILLQRETRKLDPRTFVDRIFSCQHNSGSLLNKVAWAITNKLRFNVDNCREIGEAHAAIHTNFALLQGAASPSVRKLFKEYWKERNSVRRSIGERPQVLQPAQLPEMRMYDYVNKTDEYGNFMGYEHVKVTARKLFAQMVAA